MGTRTLSEIEIAQIDVVKQVRTQFDEGSIQDLADNIAAVGLQQPIVVTPKEDSRFLLLQGERRLRAMRLLKRQRIEAVVTEVPLDENERTVRQLTENIMREDMDPFEIAAACRKLRDHGLTWEALGKVLGTSKGNAYRYEALFDAPTCVKDLYYTTGIRNITLLSDIAKLFADPKTRPAVDLFFKQHEIHAISAGELLSLRQSIKNTARDLTRKATKPDARLANKVLEEILHEKEETLTLRDVFGAESVNIFEPDSSAQPIVVFRAKVKQGDFLVENDALLQSDYKAPSDMEALVGLCKDSRVTGYAIVPLTACRIQAVRLRTAKGIYGPVLGQMVVPAASRRLMPQVLLQLKTGESCMLSVRYLSRKANTAVVKLLADSAYRIVPLDLIDRIVHIEFSFDDRP